MAWEKGKPRAESTKLKMTKFSDEQKEEVVRLYLSGLSTYQVSLQMGCGDELIRRILIEKDIPRRSRSQAIKMGLDNPKSRKKMSDSHLGVPRPEVTQTTKDKISAARRKEWKNPEYREKQIKSRRVITKKLWENEDYREKVLVGLSGSFDGRETSIEKIVRELLESLGVTFECQKVIDRCIVDFYFPNEKRIIETDGDYWHSIPEVKARDERKDAYLKKYGYEILRLTETEVHNGPLLKIKQYLGITEQ